MNESLFLNLLEEIAKDIASTAPDKLSTRDVLQVLQKHFYPYQKKPQDDFFSGIKKMDFAK